MSRGASRSVVQGRGARGASVSAATPAPRCSARRRWAARRCAPLNAPASDWNRENAAPAAAAPPPAAPSAAAPA